MTPARLQPISDEATVTTPPEQARTDEVERVAIPVGFYQWLYKIERDVRVWDLTPNEIRDLLVALSAMPAPADERVKVLEEALRYVEACIRDRAYFAAITTIQAALAGEPTEGENQRDT